MLFSRRYRQTIAVVAIGCLLLGTAYIPVPGANRKDTSVPFPCQDTACGCRDADDCWASCCCHSDAEKLAWADEHGILPPAWFRDGMARCRSANHVITETDCCAAKKKKQPESSRCCSNQAENQSSHCCATPNTGSESNPSTVCLQQQRKCNGQDDVIHGEFLFVPLNNLVPFATAGHRMLTPLRSSMIAWEPRVPTPPPQRV